MRPEVIACLELIDEADNDCKDALIASWREEDSLKRQTLKAIYQEKCHERAGLAQKLAELTKT